MAMQRLGCIFLFSGIYFLGPKNRSWRIPEDFFFFPAFSWGILHRNVVLERSKEFRFFSDFTGIFRRNSCGKEFLYSETWDTQLSTTCFISLGGQSAYSRVCKLLFFYVQIMRYSENRKFTDKEICKWADFP
jgi:hypothetical protein